jgi:hypothetical protein
MRLRPLQGTTQQGPLIPPALSRPPVRQAFQHLPRKKPSNSPPELPRILRREPATPPRENPQALGFTATLVEFFAPSAHKLKRIHSPPVYLTGYVPPSGFLTLSTDSSSLERPALFHAGNAHGVLLSRDFPSQPGPAAHRSRITLLAFLQHTPSSN